MLKYPKVLQITDEKVKPIKHKEHIIVEEKLDGSLIRISIKENEITIGSKNVDNIAYIHQDKLEYLNTPKQFKLGVDTIYNLRKRLWKLLNHIKSDEIVLFGEYLKKPRHNTLTYARVPTNHIAIFDIAVINKDVLDFVGTYILKKKYAEMVGFDVVPLLYEGKWDKQTIQKLLTTKSKYGKSIIEGVVIKYYIKDLYPLLAKWVREEFKELNYESWKPKKQNKQTIDTIIDALLTEARLNKAIQHLRDEGLLENTKRDLQYLPKEYIKDVYEEQKEWITKELWKIFEKEFKKKATKFVVNEYIKRLEASI